VGFATLALSQINAGPEAFFGTTAIWYQPSTLILCPTLAKRLP